MFVQNIPVYDAIQWTGSNQSVVENKVDQYNGHQGWSWLVDGSGKLKEVNGLFSIPQGSYYVVGPLWPGYPWFGTEILTASEFESKFSPVA